MLNTLLRLWTGPLPIQELFPSHLPNPFIHWFVHPIKRRLAKYYLLFLQKFFGLRVIAITGSVGKTTTKDMLFSILSLVSPTIATVKNITPTYSIPTAILSCTPSTRFLILEMGVEYPGDMTFYTWLAHPDIGILTSINYTHTQFFGTLSRLAAEKQHLIYSSKTSIINGDDSNIHLDYPVHKIGSQPGSLVRITSAQITSQLTTSIGLSLAGRTTSLNLPILGTHFAIPAAAAAAAAYLVDTHPQIITRGLSEFTPPPHRLTPQVTPQGHLILDDTYNASPAALQASLQALTDVCRLTHRTPVVVLAQMNELGQYETPAHLQAGTSISSLGIKHLFLLGPATKSTLKTAPFGQFCESQAQLQSQLNKLVSHSAPLAILIKGSRSWHLDQLVTQLVSPS